MRVVTGKVKEIILGSAGPIVKIMSNGLKVLTENGQQEQITLYGVSMGAATVMMTSGEKLPDNVKAIVEDCGYSTVNQELQYQLKELFNLPSFPLVNVTSGITKLRAGYFFGKQVLLSNCKRIITSALYSW